MKYGKNLFIWQFVVTLELQLQWRFSSLFSSIDFLILIFFENSCFCRFMGMHKISNQQKRLKGKGKKKLERDKAKWGFQDFKILGIWKRGNSGFWVKKELFSCFNIIFSIVSKPILLPQMGSLSLSLWVRWNLKPTNKKWKQIKNKNLSFRFSLRQGHTYERGNLSAADLLLLLIFSTHSLLFHSMEDGHPWLSQMRRYPTSPLKEMFQGIPSQILQIAQMRRNFFSNCKPIFSHSFSSTKINSIWGPEDQ